jgi:hypothetical protein
MGTLSVRLLTLALAACAPAIAAEIHNASGVEIGRTALRVRNAANAPDAWEIEMRRRFEERHATGKPWAASTIASNFTPTPRSQSNPSVSRDSPKRSDGLRLARVRRPKSTLPQTDAFVLFITE